MCREAAKTPDASATFLAGRPPQADLVSDSLSEFHAMIPKSPTEHAYMNVTVGPSTSYSTISSETQKRPTNLTALGQPGQANLGQGGLTNVGQVGLANMGQVVQTNLAPGAPNARAYPLQKQSIPLAPERLRASPESPVGGLPVKVMSSITEVLEPDQYSPSGRDQTVPPNQGGPQPPSRKSSISSVKNLSTVSKSRGELDRQSPRYSC